MIHEMGSTKQNDIKVQETLKHILDLSFRISCHSPPMKPFIRFSRQTKKIFRQAEAKLKPLIWDFDYALQKILLYIGRYLASPQQLERACIERYKTNLNNLYRRKRRELNELIEDNRPFPIHITPRDEFIFDRIRPESKFLYIGCGSGTECLRFADRGHYVIGIDTNRALTDVANSWADYLNLPFTAVSMDIMTPGFRPGSFDSFLIEFYGDQPSMPQTIALQRNLSQILHQDGIGFVVAKRKRYSSYWYLIGSPYPAKMTRWLKNQYKLDHLYMQPDGNEELLIHGLYYRSHTRDSLTSELSCFFDIIECNYETYDPRYAICVVKRKKNPESAASILEKLGAEEKKKKKYSLGMTSE